MTKGETDVVDSSQGAQGFTQAQDETVTFTKYDRRSLSYASTFDDPWKATFIRVMEAFTGKLTILRLIRKFERQGAPQGQAFWRACLDVMGIQLTTPQVQLDRIPKEGPVIVVANHPHGMVDGMIFGDLIGRVRPDYRILTRSLLTAIDEVAGSYMIPVPFPHDPDAQRKGVEMRAKAMKHLKEGGCGAVPFRTGRGLGDLFRPCGRGGMERLYGGTDPSVGCQGRTDEIPRPEQPRLPDCQQTLADAAPGAVAA